MENLNVELKNCHGIRELDAAFNFSNGHAVAVYAPNGTMKTSFAQTFKDFASGALIEGIVSRAKKFAVKRVIANEGTGLRSDDLIRAIREEFKEHEDLPNTTNPDDWAKVAGKKGEKIIHIRTISGGPTEHRQIETISTGHYL